MTLDALIGFGRLHLPAALTTATVVLTAALAMPAVANAVYRDDDVIAIVDRPTPVSAFGSQVVYSQRDPATGRYRLMEAPRRSGARGAAGRPADGALRRRHRPRARTAARSSSTRAVSRSPRARTSRVCRSTSPPAAATCTS